jgi:hypothetical protein
MLLGAEGVVLSGTASTVGGAYGIFPSLWVMADGVNNGETVPHFDSLLVPLLGKIKKSQRLQFSTGLSSGMNLLLS